MPHPRRDLGAVCFDEQQTSQMADVLPDLYDAVICVDRTIRARPLARR